MDTTKPFFSILIANFNNGQYFKECYDSLIAQTFQDFEVVIVDDCSTDDSVEVIQNIIISNSRFKLVSNEKNEGVGYTKKKIIDICSGEICAFVDPDDSIAPNALEIMATSHREEKETVLFYSNFIFCDEHLNPKKVRKTKQVERNDPYFFNYYGAISHLATFKKAFYFKSIGLNTDLKRAIDQDLYLKLYEQGKVKYIDQDLYYYRIHDGGISTNINAEKANFWHWVAILDACKRRGINPEDEFVKKFSPMDKYRKAEEKINFLQNKIDLIKKSKWIKLGEKLGLVKNFNHL